MRTSSRPAGGYTSVPPPEMKAFPELLRAAGYQPVVIDLRDPADQAWRIRAWCRPAVIERLQAAGVRFQLLQL